jgi:hypothetical protein
MHILSNAGKLKTAVFLLLAAAVLGTAAFYISGHLSSKAPQPPRAAGGVLDLEDWSFGRDGVLSLEGEWEFYWQKLLAPEDFKNGGAVSRTGYIRVPGTWNGYAPPGNGKGQKLPGEGYATYRLVVRTNGDEPVLGLKILDFATSYRLWVNGELLSENGRVGTRKDETRPQSFPRLVSFPNDAGTVEIVLQIANFTHRKGGVWTDIKMGTPGQLQALREKQAFGTLFLCGGLLIMAVYHLGLYLLRRRDRAPCSAY